MEKIKTLKDYFSKLQRTIIYNADFKIFNKAFIKKNKIDDILCCILTTFPPLYKRMLNMREGVQYKSVLSYNMLIRDIKKKFAFNPNVYMVNISGANSKINAILKTIESDINNIEKVYGNNN